MAKPVFSAADKEMGIIGGLIISLPIFFINLTGGVPAAALAAVLQFVYSFFIITLNTGICRKLAKQHPLLAVLAPTLITTALTYLLHWFAMSPEPFYSAAYACATAIAGFVPQTIRFRRSDLPIITLLNKWMKKKRKQ